MLSNHSAHAGFVHASMMQYLVIFGGETENIWGGGGARVKISIMFQLVLSNHSAHADIVRASMMQYLVIFGNKIEDMGGGMGEDIDYDPTSVI